MSPETTRYLGSGALASDQPEQYGKQPESREYGPCPLEDRLLARSAEVERLLLLGFVARRLLRARLLGLGGGGARGLLRAIGDYGSLDRGPGHDAGILAADDPAGGAPDTGCGHGGRLFLQGRTVARGLGRRRARRSGPFFGAAGDLLLQAVGELVEHLGRHVLGDAPPELGRAPGKLHVGLDIDPGTVALFMQGRDDGRRGRALAAGVAARGIQDGPAVLLVGLLELCRALVVGGDRADLDLHRALVLVALGPLYGRPRQARRYPFEVQHDVPGLLNRDAHRELVVHLHGTSFFLPIL